jgi:plasmid stabilization system protein ParE
MKYKLVVLIRARRDLREMYDWIAERSLRGAESWLAAFDRATKRVLHAPDSFRVSHECHERPDVVLREYTFKTRKRLVYRGLFTIEGNEVHLLRVRGPGQDDLTADEIPLSD